MAKFIFTFGSDDGGGWAEVMADDLKTAIDIFDIYHPRRNGMIACCDFYEEESFKKTGMYKDGNLGKREVEFIVLSHFTFGEVKRGAYT